MRIVAPFLPLPLEAPHHIEVAEGGFDWMDAIRMMSDSVHRACGCDVHVLTDVSADLPFDTFKYSTTHRRLMLWYLEIAACYLESDDFDSDTVMLDSDQLVYQDLARWFVPYMDLGILIRPTPKNLPGLPILNGVQFWPVRAKDRLAGFYRQALTIAEHLPEADQAWGADTIALDRLLAPLDVGLHDRAGLRVRMIRSDDVLEALSSTQIRHLEAGRLGSPTRAVLDFRNLRKSKMRAVYEATFPSVVEVAR